MMQLRSGSLTRAAVGLLAFAASTLALVLDPSTSASAQATVTWVSGVGDDQFSCSRTEPCKTFQGAYNKTAAGGVIHVLNPGGYGAVTLAKSITIDGGGIQSHILSSFTNGIIVSAGPNDVVVLRGLHINGAGTGTNGIRYLAGKALFVEDTTIDRVGATGGRGIDVQHTGAAQLYVSNSQIRNSNGAAIFATATTSAVISVTDTRLQNNGAGIDARNNVSVTMRGGAITGNTGIGVQVVPAVGAADANLDHVLLAFNGTAVQSGGNAREATVRLTNTTIVNNGTGISKEAPAVVLSGGRNRIAGNGTNGTFSAPVGTPPPPPTAVVCAPRPPVKVNVTPNGSGQVQVTVEATTTPDVGSATNMVQSLRFGAGQFATISGPGIPSGSTGGIIVTLPAPAQTFTFTVARTTAGQAFTVPLTVRDACNDWPTFVGGGSST